MRRRLAAYPSYRPSITARNALGSGEGTGGFAIAANILGPDLHADRRLLEADAAGGAEAAEPGRRQDHAERLESGDSRRGRSEARRRSRRPDGDHRQHAAARGGRRRRDLVLQGRAGAVPGQDPRAREPAARRRGDRPPDRAVRHRPGAHRQHRHHRARPRADDAAALGPPVRRQPDRGRRAGPRARRSLQRRAPHPRRISRCRRRCRTGCRGSRRSWTRRRRTW